MAEANLKEKLEKLANEFKNTQLWEELSDADVFGVQPTGMGMA